MKPGWAGGLVALALAAPVAASAAGRIAIDHAPVDCVLYDRYARIAATGTPADLVAAAQLQFRVEEQGGWYSVGMAARGTEWSAFLPRPIPPLARLEYRVVMRSSDADEAATPAIAVRVGGDAECGSPAQSSSAVAAPIVVRVPEGAPLVPPVPAGFSPAGVVAAEERVRKSALTTLAIGAGLAGGFTAAVVLGGGAVAQRPELNELPGFRFSRTAPVPGSVVSLSRDQFDVFLLLTGRTRIPLDFDWSFELLGVGVETVCVSVAGRATLFSFLPFTMSLTGPLFPRGACGERFDVDRSRLRVSVRGRIVFEEIQAPLPFHFEP
jgi:hypothetical protein